MTAVRSRSTGRATSRSAICEHDEVAEPREREAEAVAARHAGARVGHEGVAEERLQDRERAALGGAERAAQLREREPVRARIPERSEHEDSALDALYAVAVIRCSHDRGRAYHMLFGCAERIRVDTGTAT